MRLGITMFATDHTMPPHELAIAAEERGFASLYLPEHTHIPTSRLTPAAATPETTGAGEARFLRGTSGDETLHESYARSLDPFVALAGAAAVTATLTLGTGVALMAQREPIVTAKAAATLHHLSGGRFVLGVGYGWNREEAAGHGVVWQERRALVRERVLTMRSLWRDEVASFEGEHVRLAPSWAWPKGDIPVLFGGGAGPRLFAAIADHGDGWMPIGGAGLTEALPRLAAAYETAGRDPSTAVVIPFGTLPTPGKLDHFASLGIRETVLRVTAADRDTVLRELDAHTRYL
ncbi:TIGR03619 family F420-dependent LLM class oxidoreductase [Actinocorallia sp. API 0066]|uniref:TIGR03619 family F420-dependent LLM class oxidoreductase n=1 Tax=Actinocorallia sp. API 0066 TaxID=2896846 RepID=UPI001E407C34|nr:TIGR03619 family F420-dependent LLM class oxidoreductase [Actinocorallia sp. API 0066]MCD0448483.1 TIGR03619 family F420-dependent LLM class oxidoreductase [Actinocorallia sp. API 0066]